MSKTWWERGIGLPEMMVSAAIIAALSLASIEMFKRQSEAVKYALVRSELDAYHGRLSAILTDARNCNANFYSSMGNNSVPSLSNNAAIVQCCPTPLSNPSCTLVSGSCAVTSPAYPFAGNNRPIISLNVGNEGDLRGFKPIAFSLVDATGAAGVGGSTNVSKKAELRITYDLQSVVSGSRSVIKTIPLTFKFTTSGFVGCLDAELNTKNTLQQELCKSLDANLVTYNPVTDQCVPRITSGTHTCPAGQVLLGIDSNGDAVCSTATSAFDPSDAIDTTSSPGCDATSVIQFVQDATTQKIGIKCGP